MQFIRKFPLFFGWVLFYLFTSLLTLLIVVPIRGKDFQDLSTLIVLVLQLFAFYVFIGFLSFIASIKIVVLPSGQVKLSTYLSKWLGYIFDLILFCLPLMCRLTVSSPIEDTIRFVWQLGASYFAYRLTVSELIKEMAIPMEKDDGKQLSTV